MNPSRSLSSHLVLFFALMLSAVLGCGKGCSKGALPFVARETHVIVADSGAQARGKELVQKFECNRCHDGLTEVAEYPRNRHCVHCHLDVLENKIQASPEKLAAWKKNVEGLHEVPSLLATNARLRREWIAAFIRKPHDLRPRLSPTMPRLGMTAEEANDIAAYLSPHAENESAEVLRGADMLHGKAVFEEKGCATCHSFSGAGNLKLVPYSPMLPENEHARAMHLAPDLRDSRDKLTPERALAWVTNPKSIKSDTSMPTLLLSEVERRNVVAFILGTPLAEAPKPTFSRLPVLERRVTFDEVNGRVFHKICWHCHSNQDLEVFGDGGPGNTGGLGFAARGLDLGSFAGIQSGIRQKGSGERMSAFTLLEDRTPLLLRALLNRHSEEAGAATGEVRGMPLGYAPLSAEDIQLVESWIAQGRPRQ
ncbi:MAG: c-type cytochrome [Polyangiaceae bacterium]|nr:c-type cytochrome [Polyangiaceae bacterium]